MPLFLTRLFTTCIAVIALANTAQAAYVGGWELSEDGMDSYYPFGNIGIGVNAPEERLDIFGPVQLRSIVAPTVTANRLYNIGGTLYWNGLPVGSASGGSGVSEIFLSTHTTTGSFSFASKVGYQAGNEICKADEPVSHFCRTNEVIEYIATGDITAWQNTNTAWIAEGPPGYTSNSNDCKGWTDNNATFLGAFWHFNPAGGGMGWLTNCSVSKPLTCCK